MNNNEKNSVMNVDDYENMAVQKSNNAKRVAVGAALFVGGAAVAGSSAYAATAGDNSDLIDDSTLTADDVVDGGNVGNDYQPQALNETTERVIYVERAEEPSHEQETVQSDDPQVTWDDKTVIYDENGNLMASAESGTIDGHAFVLLDENGDEIADYLAYDQNGNAVFEENEIVALNEFDNIGMGHETAHTKEIHLNGINEGSQNGNELTQNDDHEIIHNNFEDEKTGETYQGDYAEHNRDYNPTADMSDYGNSNNYLAENDGYHEDSYSPELNNGYMADETIYGTGELEPRDDFAYENDDDETDSSNYYAENDTQDSYGDVGGDEDFLV